MIRELLRVAGCAACVLALYFAMLLVAGCAAPTWNKTQGLVEWRTR